MVYVIFMDFGLRMAKGNFCQLCKISNLSVLKYCNSKQDSYSFYLFFFFAIILSLKRSLLIGMNLFFSY